MPGPEEMSRDELIVVVRRQAGQITTMAGQLSELMETHEALAGKLAAGAPAVPQLGGLLESSVARR